METKNKKTKILVFFPNIMDRGGIENIIVTHASLINKQKFEYGIIQCGEGIGKFDSELRKNFANIFYFKDSSSFFKCYKFLKKFKKDYDIIEFHADNFASKAIFASFLLGFKKRISYSHNTNLKGPIYKKIFTSVFSNYHIADSYEAGKWLFMRKKFDIVPPSIDFKYFSFDNIVREKIRTKYHIKKDATVIGCIGHLLDEHKNQSFLIKIFAHCFKGKNAVLMLVGDGRDKKLLRDLCIELKIQDQIIFAGQTDNTFNFLCAFDVFCLPSHYEGSPISIIEAIANGLICVVSDNVPKIKDFSSTYLSLSLDDTLENWGDCLLKGAGKRSFKHTDELEIACFDNQNNIKYFERLYNSME